MFDPGELCLAVIIGSYRCILSLNKNRELLAATDFCTSFEGAAIITSVSPFGIDQLLFVFYDR